MASHIDDEEQLEVLKRWWGEYGRIIIIGVILAVGISMGWQYWQHRQAERSVRASFLYQRVLVEMAKTKSDGFIAPAQTLVSQYPRTVYASFAGLMLAKHEVEHGQLQNALTRLMWVLKHTSDTAIQQITKVRAARVLLAMGQPQHALSVLGKAKSPAFLPLFDEVRGDILWSMKKVEKAKASYRRALAALPEAASERALLKMKLSS